ncbi:hypothetical protein WM32_09140 [Burkholderia ubonensis]|nr:hypothetical protein WM32_09140 [Burkholderia ubonensis]
MFECVLRFLASLVNRQHAFRKGCAFTARDINNVERPAVFTIFPKGGHRIIGRDPSDYLLIARVVNLVKIIHRFSM